MITAPYNFVPLNKEVFYPDWAEDVSHDVPFEDGLSGSLEISIEATSPIFVRDSENDERFCSHNGKAYIPGSSVKGSMRTVLDILSYGKLKLQDKTLSYRDLNHKSYKKKAMNGDKIHMGWLEIKNGKWFVDDLGTVTSSNSRIKYEEMTEYLDEKLIRQIKNKSQAYEKYNLVKDRNMLDIGKGTIVFTGKVGRQKTREFLFPNQIKDRYEIDKSVVETFKQAYYIGGTEESDNWKKLWKKELADNKKIPVFFQMKEKNIVAHFGLSMLYKLPYEQSLLEILKKNQAYDAKRLDLGETIFGHVNDDDALKGRVSFSHFMIDKEIKLNKKAFLPLSSPRATYFPSYLEQDTNRENKVKNYKTYDDKDAVLRGFKFYFPQKEASFGKEICKKHPQVCTSFYPLDKGSSFKGKVRFFNLKECELGALIATLTFMGEVKCHHKIGMAKPFGFGTVKVSLEKIVYTQSNEMTVDKAMESFVTCMNKYMKINLREEKRIKALFSLSSYGTPKRQLEYMELKDFANKKKARFALPSIIETQKVSHPAVSSKEDTGISKTRMRKAIMAYWQEKFSTMYHRNQIKEFFSKEGFKSTPLEQQTLYVEQKDNESFVKFCQVIHLFEFGDMSEESKEKLYTILTKDKK
ncbi:TIGR03986 family CRISPR-associated RAMP protein [Sulfurovum sp.]|uniref:TIGR03986 family type III CRISPR-associated RAMP protein n=1 Tax=Sulfurovum sp. TaxID=1969726 RepID=UPI0025E83CC6|nr:TIGR03986 family CRISPR-associated RAMP protein [Sulfurovum sp.]